MYAQTTLKDLVSPQDSAVADTLGNFGSVAVAALFSECDILLENREHLEREVLWYLYYQFARGSSFYVCLDLGHTNRVLLSAVLNDVPEGMISAIPTNLASPFFSETRRLWILEPEDLRDFDLTDVAAYRIYGKANFLSHSPISDDSGYATLAKHAFIIGEQLT